MLTIPGSIKFSLLLCTYKNDNPQHLKECLDSISAQTVLPDEVVIVKDGLLTTELDEVLSNASFTFKTSIIPLPTHQTQGIARREGVAAAKHDWIALMDSDDIMLPNRFEKQLEAIRKNPNIDILGGQIAEFSNSQSQVHAIRQVPVFHDDILTFAKTRNPFNAMTVMFKKDIAIESGNFRYFPGFEDYDLWVRMIKNGAVCHNYEEVLVNVRTGYGMYSRRRGISYIKNEWRMQRQLRYLNITTIAQFMMNIIKRIPVRLLPDRILASVYLKFARHRALTK